MVQTRFTVWADWTARHRYPILHKAAYAVLKPCVAIISLFHSGHNAIVCYNMPIFFISGCRLYVISRNGIGEGRMTLNQIDGLVQTLLPKVLSDPDLGNGRTFTSMHLRHLWALSCLYAEECYDEQTVELCVARHLPSNVLMVREVASF